MDKGDKFSPFHRDAHAAVHNRNPASPYAAWQSAESPSVKAHERVMPSRAAKRVWTAILCVDRPTIYRLMPPTITPPADSFVTLPDDKAKRVFDEALDRLSSVQRQVFLMRLRSDTDLDRIALRLGLSRDTARASLAYAVAQLRMILSDAPMDKQRDDWLRRCRRLLVRPVRRDALPAVEIDFPSLDVEPAAEHPEPVALIVESRPDTSARLPSGIETSPQPRSEPQQPPTPAAPAGVVIPPAKAPAAAPSRPRHTRGHGLWLRLPAALGLLVVAVTGGLAWYVFGPHRTVADDVIRTEPQRVPALDAPAPPLTASDFRLVLLRQQQKGVLEDLDFYIWLSEQDDLP